MWIFEICGIIGLSAILIAFILLQRSKLSDDSHLYNLLNIFGGIFIAIYTAYHKAWFSVILNVVWAFVALLDLIKNIKNNKAVD